MSQASVITLSILLLVGLVAAVTIGVLNYVNNDDKRPATSTKAVQEMCQPTDYKEACFKSLSKVHSDDPKELVKAAFESTITELNEVVSKSVVLKELEKDPKTAEAVKDCKELFQDAVGDLRRSFGEMGEFDFNKVDKMLENLKIWLSATLTYQETCLDGFDNTTGDASAKVRKILETSMQMSSNGLAIVTEMSTLLGTLDMSSFTTRRRLLVDDRQIVGHDKGYEIPYWQRSRRLLSSTDNAVEGHDGDNTLLEDDEPDRRRKLLSSVNRVVGHELDEGMPSWVDGRRRKLLEATNLAEDLKGMANVVVAQDGSGKYKTIEEALTEIPKNGNESFIIYIKEGVYNEYLALFKWMTHVVFIGDGPTKTRITNNKNFADGVKTFKTATLSVLGDYFMAKDIGIENSAGAIKHQAVALRVQSDQSIFYNCHMDGYQDTLYAHTYRQYYRDCRVTGTIDFIFGDAASFFQNCTFVIRKPLENQRCIVTAQGRMERHQPTGIFIHKCRFEADPEYYPVRKNNTAYLARPWKEYSKTIIMESYIDDSIAPEGWLPWEGTFALDTCYYGEYNNFGPGSDMSNRVAWRGIKTIDYGRAEGFMPPQLYGNDDWIRASSVPYDPTLDALAPGPASGYEEDPNAPQAQPSSILSSYFSGVSSSGSSTSSSSSSTASAASHSSSSGSSSSGGSSSSSGTPSGGSSSFIGSSGSSTSASNGGSIGGSSTTTTPSTVTGGSTSGASLGSSTTTPSTASRGSTGGASSGSSTTTPSTANGGSTGGASSGSSTTTPSTASGGSTGGASSGSSTTSGGSIGGASSGSSTTTPSTASRGSISGASSGSSTATPSTANGGSTRGASSGSSTTTPSATNNGGITSGGLSGSSITTTTPSTSSNGATSSSTTTPTTSDGNAAEESSLPPSTSIIDAPAPSPTSTESLAPTYTPLPSTVADTTQTTQTAATPTSSTPVKELTPANELTPSSSPTSSETNDNNKQTGPITVRELERILMTNEEMGEEDNEANDDMSGNVPDGDEPSPAMVGFIAPIAALTSAPTPVESPIFVSPVGSPTESGLSPSPSMSPSDEIGDWLPPAMAPGPDVEPADKAPPTNAPPPKSNDARSNFKGVYELHVVLSGLMIWVVALAM